MASKTAAIQMAEVSFVGSFIAAPRLMRLPALRWQTRPRQRSRPLPSRVAGITPMTMPAML
jgi:hypothetical protein